MHTSLEAPVREARPTLAPDAVDLRDPRWLTDPQDLFRRLRPAGRVHRGGPGLWLLLDHADCRAVMQSSQLSRDPRQSTAYQQMRPFIADSALEQVTERFMLFNDPPVHTRMRRAIGAAFTPVAVRSLRDTVQRLCEELLSHCPDDEPFDAMAGLAQVLPVQVICSMLGIPDTDRAQTKAWSEAIARVVEPLNTRSQREQGVQATVELSAQLRRHVAHRRAHPGHSLLDLMIAAQQADASFDDDELLANLILLFVAGHETTTNLLGNGLLTLLRHPAQLALLRQQPELMPQAVEEMLRFESPVNMVARVTLRPWTLGELTLPAGETLYCMLGAANHDPAVFADPGRFDIRRDPNPQLAFGGGIHYCVGAPLARLEAEVAFAALLARYPRLGLVDAAPQWRPMINLRGLQSLRVQGRAAG